MLNSAKGKIHTKYFKYNDFCIKVKCNKLAPVQWLIEFLSPPFETSIKTSKQDCEVFLSFDEAEYDFYKKMTGNKVHKTIDAFALDTRMIRLPTWKLNKNGLIVFEDRAEVFYHFIPTNDYVRIIAKFDRRSVRKALMRVVREFAMNQIHRQGNLIVHGSAFSSRGKGFVITGPKKAGKTTLLIKMLNNKVANFIANDRVAVGLHNSKPTLKGIPTIVNIREKTIDMFSELKDNLISRNFVYHLNTDETDSAELKSIKPDRLGNYSISPRQLCHLLKVNHASEASLSALLFPEITAKLRGKIVVKDVSPEKAAEKLMSSLFRAGSKKLASSAFNNGRYTDQPDRIVLKARCLDLTSKVRSVYCYLGSGAFDDDHTVSTFIENILT